MRGDRVEVVVDLGNATRTFDIVATKAGRRVEVAIVRGTVEVTEVTRSGQAVRSARFLATRVVAVVEHPAGDPGDDDVAGSRAGAGGPAGRRRPPENQGALDL